MKIITLLNFKHEQVPVFTIILIFLSILQFPSIAQVKSLDYFIDQRLINIPVLKDISNRRNSNSVDSLLFKAGQKPQVSL